MKIWWNMIKKILSMFKKEEPFEIESIIAERDSLKIELENLMQAHEELRLASIKLVATQRDLIILTERMREENTILRMSMTAASLKDIQ